MSETAGPRHSHDHGPAAGTPRRRLVLALVLVGASMALEVATAFFAHSLALLADAGHLLTDVGALLGVLWTMDLARRPGSPTHSFGLKRAEILSAAANGVTLVAVALALFIEALQRLWHPASVRGGVMVVVAAIGILINVAATAALAQGRDRSLNLRGAFEHLLSDLYGVAATAVAGVIILTTGWERVDPLATLVVVALVARAGWRLLRASGHILLEGTPESVDLETVRDHLLALPEVLSVHDLHAWTLTSDLPALTAHVVVTDECLGRGGTPAVLDRLQQCLAEHFDVEHSTFQIEAARHVEHESGTHD